jgi:ribonuclease HII
MLKSSFTHDKIEAGCDEVGRGALAGPVVAAAVVLPKDYKHAELTDSKQLSKIKREKIRKEIINDALAYAVAEVSCREVDSLNVLKASILAMHRAVDRLKIVPELLLIDGNKFVPYGNIPHHCIVKGDRHYLSIAAASVLAKTHRDSLMAKLGVSFPAYCWEHNVGYPTKEHRIAIEKNGITPFHRRTFRLLSEQLPLFD